MVTRPHGQRARAVSYTYCQFMILDKTFRLKAQLSVLRDVQKDYQGLTIENIIKQLESRVEHLTKQKRHD